VCGRLLEFQNIWIPGWQLERTALLSALPCCSRACALSFQFCVCTFEFDRWRQPNTAIVSFRAGCFYAVRTHRGLLQRGGEPA